jgi:hypothetical protein
MKKYFVKDTEEELEFGDVISVEFCKELEDGSVTREMEVCFSPDNVEPLLHFGVIEEADVEEEDDMIDFSEDEDYCPHNELIGALCEEQEAMKEKIDILEKKINTLQALLKKETASLRKK